MLETVSTDDLWYELQKRFRTSLLCYTQDTKIKGQSCSNIWWNGSTAEILGLAKYAEIHIIETIKEGFCPEDA